MSAQSSTALPAKKALTAVEVLDFGSARNDALKFFLSDPSRKDWPQDKVDRIQIRTECKWGRVVVQGEDGTKAVLMLNENGEGPKKPLSDKICAYVALYAAVSPRGDDPGYFSQEPFAKIPVNEQMALKLRSSGMVALEKFISKTGVEFEAAYKTWMDTINAAHLSVNAIRAKRAAKAAGTTQSASLPKEIPVEGVSDPEQEQGPRARV